MKKHNRSYLWLSLNILSEALRDKRHLEALAFSIMLKQKYTSSVMWGCNYSEVSLWLGVGKLKSKRIIKDAVEFGYVIESNGNFTAGKIRESKEVNFILTSKNVSGLKSMVLKLRQVALMRHIYHANYVAHTLNNYKVAQSNKAKRQIEGWLRYYGVTEQHNGVSITRICEIIGVKNRNTVVTIINDLIDNGMITKSHNDRVIYDGIDARGYFMCLRDNGMLSKDKCSYYVCKRGIVKRESNIYQFTEKIRQGKYYFRFNA